MSNFLFQKCHSYSSCILTILHMYMQAELAERASKAVKEWMSSKDAQLLERRKQRTEEITKQRDVVEEKEQRQQVAELASHKWREEKTKQYVAKHQEIKRKAREEERRKQEEAEEKGKSAAQALKVWYEECNGLSDETMHGFVYILLIH